MQIIMEWNKEKILKLIKEFEKRPLLWRMSDGDYHDTAKKENAWCEIAQALDTDIDSVKWKIDSTRGSYRREKFRIRRSQLQGQGPTYSTKWYAFKHLKFLDSCSSVRTRPYPKKRQAINCNRVQVGHRTENALNHEINSGNVERKDVCTVFGDYIAQKMRQFDRRNQIIFEHRIHNLIFELEMQSVVDSTALQLAENNSTPTVIDAKDLNSLHTEVDIEDASDS